MTRMTQLIALVTAIGIVALPPKALADRGWFSETSLAVIPVTSA